MNLPKSLRYLLSICIVFLLNGPVSGGPPPTIIPLTVIANSEVPVDTLSIGELRDIYLGNSKQWNDKSKIRPSYYNSKSGHAKYFFDEYLGISAMKFRRHWLKKVFRGDGSAPLAFGKTDDVITYVANNPGAIGVVAQSNIDTTLGIKTLVIGLLDTK